MNSVTFDFAGAKALVTGGTSGIGYAIASQFAKAGAAVTVTGTRASAEDYPEQDLSALTFRQCQASDTEAIDALADSLDDLDILVNNAGGPYAGGKDEWDPDGYVGSVAVNMSAHMRLTMACPCAAHGQRRPGRGERRQHRVDVGICLGSAGACLQFLQGGHGGLHQEPGPPMGRRRDPCQRSRSGVD